jgi:hypothetical protein
LCADPSSSNRPACSSAFGRRIKNNLAVILIHKSWKTSTAAGDETALIKGTKLARESTEWLKEAVVLLEDALRLQPTWSEAQHNLKMAKMTLQ